VQADRTIHPLRDERPANFRGILRDDVLARELYSEGAGILRSLPAAVAVPTSTEDLSALVVWAKRAGHSLMARGSGSGMAAGAIGTGIALDLSQRKGIGAVNTQTKRVLCDPGALRSEIEARAKAVGLRFPVDPSSGAFCTIGGMVAANAAGARTLHYGATRAWVAGVECVFDDGSVAWIRRGEPLPLHIQAVARLARTIELMRPASGPSPLQHAAVLKEASGYAIAAALRDGGHLLDVLVGSEGTLAVFSQIELMLTDAVGATAALLAKFDSLEAATECAVRARASGASACELLDRTFLTVAASQGAHGVPSGAEAVLLAEVEGENASDAANNALLLAAAFRTAGAREIVVADGVETQHELWSLRHAASPILASLAPRVRSMQFIEDGCVPPDALPAYVRGVRAALDKANFPGVIFGHAGDAHVHVNPLVDVTQADWHDRVRGALLAVCELTGRLNGTLSGEHGDGRLRAGLLPHVWSAEARAAFANIKDAGDPAGVFNAGCKVAAPNDEFVATLRYDPLVAPLSAEARVILDQIEKTRSWSRFRLGELGAAPLSTAPNARH
jgi:FAD/FMN-containing dehydrogenase